MKNLCCPEIARFRDSRADEIAGTPDDVRAWGGAFMVTRQGHRLRVIASRGDPEAEDVAERWDHVSVSLMQRCPTWEEMEFVKRLFFKPEEVAFQLHVATAAHISRHPFCLHIWRPLDFVIPLPPVDLV